MEQAAKYSYSFKLSIMSGRIESSVPNPALQAYEVDSAFMAAPGCGAD